MQLFPLIVLLVVGVAAVTPTHSPRTTSFHASTISTTNLQVSITAKRQLAATRRRQQGRI